MTNALVRTARVAQNTGHKVTEGAATKVGDKDTQKTNPGQVTVGQVNKMGGNC